MSAWLSELEAIMSQAERGRLHRLLERTVTWTSIREFCLDWASNYPVSVTEAGLAAWCLTNLGLIEVRDDLSEVRATASFEIVFLRLLG